MASISELLEPHLAPGPDSLALYTQSVSVVVVLGISVLASAIASLPLLDEHPWVCATVVTATTMAFLWSPGQNLFFDGFATFWLGTLTAATAIVLSIDPRRPFAFPRVLAVIGLLLAVSQTWAPLLILAAVAVFPFCVDIGTVRIRRGQRWKWLIGAGFVVLIGIALQRVLDTLTQRASMRFLVTATGGITGTSPVPTFVLLVAALYICLAFKSWIVTDSSNVVDRLLARRVRILVAIPLIAMASAGAFLVAQLSLIGTTSYFFLKYFVGIELILAGWVPAVLGILIAVRLPRSAGLHSVVPGVVSVLLASQVFAPFPWASVGWRAQPGGTASVGAPHSVTAMADGLVCALGTSNAVQSLQRDYVALGKQRGAQAFYLDAWYHAVFATSSPRVGGRLEPLRINLNDATGAAHTVQRVLSVDPGVKVIVAPDEVAQLRKALGNASSSRRVMTWYAERNGC